MKKQRNAYDPQLVACLVTPLARVDTMASFCEARDNDDDPLLQSVHMSSSISREELAACSFARQCDGAPSAPLVHTQSPQPKFHDGASISMKFADPIGCGVEGTVVRAFHHGVPLAVKTPTERLSATPREDLANIDVCSCLRKHRNKHLVTIHHMGQFSQQGRATNVIEQAQELCDVSLAGLMMSRRPTHTAFARATQTLTSQSPSSASDNCISEDFLRIVARCVLKGLVYLHESVGVAHNDIHPGNVLISSEKKCFKIADFGKSTFLDAHTSRKKLDAAEHGSQERSMQSRGSSLDLLFASASYSTPFNKSTFPPQLPPACDEYAIDDEESQMPKTVSSSGSLVYSDRDSVAIASDLRQLSVMLWDLAVPPTGDVIRRTIDWLQPESIVVTLPYSQRFQEFLRMPFKSGEVRARHMLDSAFLKHAPLNQVQEEGVLLAFMNDLDKAENETPSSSASPPRLSPSMSLASCFSLGGSAVQSPTAKPLHQHQYPSYPPAVTKPLRIQQPQSSRREK